MSLCDPDTANAPPTSVGDVVARHNNAVAKILASRTFSGSARLTGFLRFICSETLAGRDKQLNEQSVGQGVFGRPDTFNPAEDSIVRSSARLLRQRLERYYADEGMGETVRVVLPRGCYVPLFVDEEPAALPVPLPVPAADSGPAAASDAGGTVTRRFSRRSALLALGGSVGVAAAMGVPRLLPPDPVDDMWRSLLVHDRNLLLVPADSGLVIWQSEHHRALALDDYLGAKRLVGEPPVPDAGAWSDVRGRRYTGVVSMRLAMEMARRAGTAASRVRVRFPRDLHLNELKEANAVLVGAGNSNPWVQLFHDKCAFRIDLEGDDGFVALNHAPMPGEQARYRHTPGNDASPGYAHLALKPNLDGQGRVLMIGGTGSAGTEAGIDFLLDPVALPKALAHLNPSGARWDGFEVLLQLRVRGDNSTGYDVLAARFWPRA